MRIQVAPLLIFDTPLRPVGNLPLPILDLLVGQAFRAHVLSDSALHGFGRLGMIVEPLARSTLFHDTVFAQDP